MKKLLVFLCAMFAGVVAFAQTINVTWKADNTTYATNTCEYGGTLTVPSTPPTKYGYTFQGWDSYTFLEYIESTGTQYIDTGATITSTYQRVVSKFSTDSTDSDLRVFGSQDQSGNCAIVPWPAITPKYPWGYLAVGTSWYKPNGQSTPVNTAVNTAYEMDITANNGTLTGTYCGQTVSTTYEGRLNNNLNITLFGNKRQNDVQRGPTAKVKIYYYKLYTAENSLSMNLLPVRRNSDGVLCMYDTVSETFFTNAGTGEFIAGPEVQ